MGEENYDLVARGPYSFGHSGSKTVFTLDDGSVPDEFHLGVVRGPIAACRHLADEAVKRDN